MADIPGYAVSIAQRIPHQNTAATFIELGPVHASGLSWTEELTREGEHTASTSPDTLDPAIVTRLVEQLDNDDEVPGLELWIWRDAVLVARGPIIGLQVQADTWTFRAAGPLYYLRYMVLPAITFTQVDQHTIGKTLIDSWQDLDYGHYGLDTGSIGLSGVVRDRTYEAGDNVYQRLVELAEVDNGFDVWVDADLTVRFGVKGSDLSGSVVLDRRGITNSGLSLSFAAGDLASEAFGRNTDDAVPLSSEQSNTALRESFGRAGVAATFDGVTQQATLDDHTRAMLDARVRPLVTPQPQLIPVSGAGIDDFTTGDVVQFAPRIGVDGLVLERRVLRRSVSVSDTGSEEMGLVLS